jgi:hypothetical protein
MALANDKTPLNSDYADGRTLKRLGIDYFAQVFTSTAKKAFQCRVCFCPP